MDDRQTAIKDALSTLIAPDGKPLPASPLFGGFELRGSEVFLMLSAPRGLAPRLSDFAKDIETRLESLTGISRALVSFSAERRSDASLLDLPDIRHIIAVASGKGGVGKSTTAANLAIALAARGIKIGLLDADIYGPSVPALFGLTHPPEQDDKGQMLPALCFGVKVLSIGTMVEKSAALIWRGPMIDKVLTQFLRDAAWGELDVLLIDLPPGTGDAQLTLTRRLDLCGAVIVSTPQDMALIDARKAINLFREAEVPILGLIENMSQFICPCCGKQHDIFDHGGARREADNEGLHYLGDLPLHIDIRRSADDAAPIATTNHRLAANYHAIADQLLARLNLAPDQEKQHAINAFKA